MNRNALVHRTRVFSSEEHKIKKIQSGSALLTAGILLGIIALSAVVFSLSSSSVVVVSSSGTITSTSPISPLHVEGCYIKDSQNNTVILRGVDIAGFQADLGGVWQGQFFSTTAQWQSGQSLVIAELNEIQSLGCNLIRCHTDAQWFIQNTSGYDTTLQQLATLCAARGIYVIFDGYYVVAYGSGATQDPLPYPPYSTSTGASSIIPSQAAFVNYVVREATIFKNSPNVIIEPWNEPSHGDCSNKANVLSTGYLQCVENITSQVRALDLSNIILIQWDMGIWENPSSPPPAPPASSDSGTLQWITWLNLTGVSNIAYSFHDYDFGNQFSDSQNWTYSQVVSGLTSCWIPYALNTLHVPLICGEIGPESPSESGTAQTNDVNTQNETLTAFRIMGVGFTAYCFDGAGGGGWGMLSSYAPSWSTTSWGTIAEWNILKASSL